MPRSVADKAPHKLAQSLRKFLDSEVHVHNGATKALKPGHRVPFHWPPHPISYSFHIHPTDWRGEAEVEIQGEKLPVLIANTPFGVFGRCESIWLEARGKNVDEALDGIRKGAKPLFDRQTAIAKTLGMDGRFTGHLRDLNDLQLLKLLYCSDRDVSHEAQTVIELHASRTNFLPAMIEILRDARHPMRRAAQWAVLDLFEDLPSFAKSESGRRQAVQAMRDLIWDATDDHARTIYKAGVVLGGHLPADTGGKTLIECLGAPSPYGRRSAIHGLFHVVEWEPKMRKKVVSAIRSAAASEKVKALKEYALKIAADIEKGAFDHVAEPAIEGES